MTSTKSLFDRHTLYLFAGVLLVASFLLFFRLGDRALRNPDEGRYAEVAREMLRSGDWLKPTLLGVGYLRKPILFYWLTAGSFQIFGLSEWSARLVPAFASLCGVAAVFWFCIRFFSRKTALFACAILATNLMYLQVGRYLVIDAVFTLFILGALFSYYLGFHSEKNRGFWYGVFYISLALAFLAKGFIAIALAGAALGTYLIATRRVLKALGQRHLFLGIPVFLFLAGPWYFLMEQREPGFLKFFFGHEHWLRFVSANFEHQEPWFYYLLLLPLLGLPWILFWRPMKQVFSRVRQSIEDPAIFLGISIAAIVVFFSLSRSKMPTYLLPCLPMGAILLASGWSRWLESRPVLGVKEGLVLVPFVLLGIGAMIGPSWVLEMHPNQFPEAIVSDLRILGGSLLAGIVVCWRSIRRGGRERFFYALAATIGLASLLFSFVMETMNSQYTTKAFALYLKDRVSVAEDIYVYDHPGPFYDFAFYLDRNVKVVGLEGELEHSRRDADAGKVSVSRDEFFDLLKQNKKLYCLIRRSDFIDLEEKLGLKFKVLMRDPRKVLFLLEQPAGAVG